MPGVGDARGGPALCPASPQAGRLFPRTQPLPPAGRAGRRLGTGWGRQLPLGATGPLERVGELQEARSPFGPGAPASLYRAARVRRSHRSLRAFAWRAGSLRPAASRGAILHQAGTRAPTVSIRALRGRGGLAAVAPFPGLGPSSLWRCTPAGIAPGRGRLLPGPSYFPRLGGRDCGRGRGRGRLARPPAGGPGRGRVGAELGRDPPARPCHACPARDLVKGSALFFLSFFFFALLRGPPFTRKLVRGSCFSAPWGRARGTGGPGSWRYVLVSSPCTPQSLPLCTRWTRQPFSPFSAPRAWGRASAFLS